jgi:hypothetical protein
MVLVGKFGGTFGGVKFWREEGIMTAEHEEVIHPAQHVEVGSVGARIIGMVD